MEVLIKIKAFLKKYWWIVAGVLLMIIWTVLARGRGGQALGDWRDIQKRIDKVDEKKQEELHQVEVKREERIQEIEEQHAEVVEALKEENEDEYEKLRRDPRKLNARLNSLLPR